MTMKAKASCGAAVSLASPAARLLSYRPDHFAPVKSSAKIGDSRRRTSVLKGEYPRVDFDFLDHDE